MVDLKKKMSKTKKKKTPNPIKKQKEKIFQTFQTKISQPVLGRITKPKNVYENKDLGVPL